MQNATIGTCRAGMMALVLAAGLALAAETAPPARGATPAAATASSWRPAACPPPAESGTGQGNLKVTGPCGFEHKGEAECESVGDDLLVTLVRKGKRPDTEVMLFINVERFVGPGRYKPPNDIFVSLKDGENIWRWYTNEFEMTVGPGSASVTLHDVQLKPELLLIGCTGPQTNYQCDGRGDDPKHMESLTVADGTIVCKGGGTSRRKKG